MSYATERIYEILDSRPVSELRGLLQAGGSALETLLRAEYLPAPWPPIDRDDEDTLNAGAEYAPDSEMASESATADEQRMEVAARTWGKLSLVERETLLAVATRIEADAGDIREALDMRLPFDWTAEDDRRVEEEFEREWNERYPPELPPQAG
jgi:hypothetical protein